MSYPRNPIVDEALRLILTKSPHAAALAAQALNASLMSRSRYCHLLPYALHDAQAAWTREDRMLLARAQGEAQAERSDAEQLR